MFVLCIFVSTRFREKRLLTTPPWFCAEFVRCSRSGYLVFASPNPIIAAHPKKCCFFLVGFTLDPRKCPRVICLHKFRPSPSQVAICRSATAFPGTNRCFFVCWVFGPFDQMMYCWMCVCVCVFGYNRERKHELRLSRVMIVLFLSFPPRQLFTRLRESVASRRLIKNKYSSVSYRDFICIW